MKAILGALVFLLIGLDVIAQQYLYDSWEVKDGLPQNSITDIIQTADGYLWIGTEGGLSRFDGAHFKNFDVQNAPALGANRIRDLFENSNGDLLIATSENLVAMRNGVFTNLSEKYNYQIGRILSIQRVNENQLTISNNSSDSQKIDRNTYAPLPVRQEELKKATAIDLILHPSREMVSKDETGSTSMMSDLHNAIIMNDAILLNSDSLIFWHANEETLTLYQGPAIIEQFTISSFFEPGINPLIFAYGPFIYLINRRGGNLVTINTKTKELIQAPLPKPCVDGQISCAYMDREENLWLGSSICGLFKIKPSRFTYVDPDSLSFNRNIYPVLKDSKNRILLGSSEDGLLVFDEYGHRYENPDHPSASNRFISSITEHEGAIYFASINNSNIIRWHEQKFSTIPFENNTYTQANALYTTHSGELLVGAYDGLFQMKGDVLSLHPICKEKYVRFVNTLFEDRRNQLWILTSLNAFCFDQKSQKTVIDFKERWPQIQEYRSMHEDLDGRKYFGTYGFGLCVLVDDSMHVITSGNGLAENVVSSITEDGNGNIWLTGNKGLSRIRKAELLQILSGEKTLLNTVIYNEQSDALRSGEFNGGIQQSKFHLGGHKYIFPTLKGAVVVDFDEMRENKLAPPVHIETLQYGDSTFQTYAAENIDYSGGRAEFFFTALSFVAPEKVAFKYQLQGYDTDWVDAGNDRRAVYSKLPPGSYTFKVIAANDEGVWNLAGASYSFNIIPPFYLTWWFRLLAILLALGLTAASARLYVLRNQKNQRDKSAMLDILPDLVFKIDRHGKYIDIYGNPAELVAPAIDLKNRYLTEFLPKQLASRALEVVNNAIETQEIQQFDYDLTDGSGGIKHYEGRFIAIDKREVLCIIRDTTESRMADEQIRSSESRLRKALEKEKRLLKKLTEQQKIQLEAIIDTEEKERRRIAADLHDGLGQLLSSVKINLGVASDKINEEKLKETAVLVNKSKIAIDLITAELRNISYNLLPPSIEQFGLASAIEEEVLKLSVDPNRRIFFDHSLSDIKFDQRVEVVLFRIFQELMNNAIKHANASEITLQLIQHEKEIVFMIEDNGSGFDFHKGLSKKSSSGLKNLQSRINLLKGKLSIDSQPGSGTSVTIKIPI